MLISAQASRWKLQGVGLCWCLLQPALPKLQSLQQLMGQGLIGAVHRCLGDLLLLHPIAQNFGLTWETLQFCWSEDALRDT